MGGVETSRECWKELRVVKKTRRKKRENALKGGNKRGN